MQTTRDDTHPSPHLRLIKIHARLPRKRLEACRLYQSTSHTHTHTHTNHINTHIYEHEHKSCDDRQSGPTKHHIRVRAFKRISDLSRRDMRYFCARKRQASRGWAHPFPKGLRARIRAFTIAQMTLAHICLLSSSNARAQRDL